MSRTDISYASAHLISMVTVLGEYARDRGDYASSEDEFKDTCFLIRQYGAVIKHLENLSQSIRKPKGMGYVLSTLDAESFQDSKRLAMDSARRILKSYCGENREMLLRDTNEYVLRNTEKFQEDIMSLISLQKMMDASDE